MKKFFKGLLILILLLVVIGLFLPSEIRVKRSIEINAAQETIFKQVNNFKNWNKWSPWEQKDPDMTKKYSENPAGKGAWQTWKSESQGNGKQTIIESNPPSKLKTKLEFEDQGTSYGFWNLEKTDDENVKATWAMETDFGWNLIGRYIGLGFDGMLGPDFEKGLQNLKELTENMPKISSIKVRRDEVTESKWLLTIRDTVAAEQIESIHQKLYEKIMGHMKTNDIEQDGAPMAIYHDWSDSSAVIEAGIPITDSVETQGNINLRKSPTGKVITATHYGSYDRLPETYYSINEWIKKNGVMPIGPPWEVYITDPATEPDRSKWETNIYYPVN